MPLCEMLAGLHLPKMLGWSTIVHTTTSWASQSTGVWQKSERSNEKIMILDVDSTNEEHCGMVATSYGEQLLTLVFTCVCGYSPRAHGSTAIR